MYNRTRNPHLYPIPLPLDAKTFIANGTQYFINSNILLSPKRLAYIREFAFALPYQRNPLKYIEDIVSLDTPVNLGDQEEIKRTLERIMNALQTVEKFNYGIEQYICALFINRQDEDLNEFDLADAALKVKDWGRFEAEPFKKWANEFLARLNN